MKQQQNMRNEENIDQIARSKQAITILSLTYKESIVTLSITTLSRSFIIYFREPTKTHKNEFAFEINNWFIIGKI